MKHKFFGQEKSTEIVPRVATVEERAKLQRIIDLGEQARLLYEEKDRLVSELPRQEAICAKVVIADRKTGIKEQVWTTFVVDRPEWIMVKARDIDLTKDDPTTKDDLKTLRASGAIE